MHDMYIDTSRELVERCFSNSLQHFFHSQRIWFARYCKFQKFFIHQLTTKLFGSKLAEAVNGKKETNSSYVATGVGWSEAAIKDNMKIENLTASLTSSYTNLNINRDELPSHYKVPSDSLVDTPAHQHHQLVSWSTLFPLE